MYTFIDYDYGIEIMSNSQVPVGDACPCLHLIEAVRYLLGTLDVVAVRYVVTVQSIDMQLVNVCVYFY